MATTTPDRPATLTVPAAYLEDLRDAALREVDSDTSMLRTNQADFVRLGSDEARADRDLGACILTRDTQLLETLLAATGEIELTSEQDRRSCPLVDTLEEVVRLLAERLSDAAGYAPVPMGDVLEITDRLRWAATEAIRIEPTMDDRLASDETGAA